MSGLPHYEDSAQAVLYMPCSVSCWLWTLDGSLMSAMDRQHEAIFLVFGLVHT